MRFAAIETRYAGCRFRSRLEARWAVVFDALGIDWHYEHQGYEFAGERYLPDFTLTNYGGAADVEVKGEMTDRDEAKILRFAAYGPGSLLVLRDLPRVDDAAPAHGKFLVRVYDGDEYGNRVDVYDVVLTVDGITPVGFPTPVAVDLQSGHVMPALPIEWDLKPLPVNVVSARSVANAIEAGRSARFEHGECGALR